MFEIVNVQFPVDGAISLKMFLSVVVFNMYMIGKEKQIKERAYYCHSHVLEKAPPPILSKGQIHHYAYL